MAILVPVLWAILVACVKRGSITVQIISVQMEVHVLMVLLKPLASALLDSKEHTVRSTMMNVSQALVIMEAPVLTRSTNFTVLALQEPEGSDANSVSTKSYNVLVSF